MNFEVNFKNPSVSQKYFCSIFTQLCKYVFIDIVSSLMQEEFLVIHIWYHAAVLSAA